MTLGDPRAPGAFLDRLENDPGGTALAPELLQAAGSFRRPEDADRLLAVLENDRKRGAAVFHGRSHHQRLRSAHRGSG